MKPAVDLVAAVRLWRTGSQLALLLTSIAFLVAACASQPSPTPPPSATAGLSPTGSQPSPTPPPSATAAPSPTESPSPVAVSGTVISPRPAPVRTYQWTAHQLGDLKVEVRDEPVYQWPLELVRAHLRVTNTGSSSLHGSGFSARAVATGQDLVPVPNPPFLYLDPGQSIDVSTNVGEANGLNDLLEASKPILISWTFAGFGSLTTTAQVRNVMAPGAPSMRVAGTVIDAAGQPVGGALVTVGAAAHSLSVTSDGAGRFSVTVPQSTRWVASAALRGYRTAFAFLDEARDYPDVLLRLAPQPDRGLRVGPASSAGVGVAMWQGVVGPDQQEILFGPGEENWIAAMAATRADQVAAMYASSGQLLWTHQVGWDAKGVDISADGKYAAVVVTNASRPPAPRNVPGHLDLLDAVSGRLIWSRPASAFPAPHVPAGICGPQPCHNDSIEIRFTPDGKAIAMGSTFGDFYLVDRADGHIIWSSFTAGTARTIVMAPDGSSLFAVSGDGLTYRMALADGHIEWRAETGNWAHQTGAKLSPDGQLFGVTNEDGTITMLDAGSGQVLWSEEAPATGHWADFSPDSTVFVASTIHSTQGWEARTGNRLFFLGGSNGGKFAQDPAYFVMAGGGPGSDAVYDQYGTRVSNYFSGLDYTAGGNYYFAWLSSDASRLVFAQSSLLTPGEPALFFMAATPGGLPTDLPTTGNPQPGQSPGPQPSASASGPYCPPSCPGPPAPGTHPGLTPSPSP